jgi:hypothetical protein
MSKTNTWETGLLNLLFANITFAGVGDAGGLLQSVADGSLYLSLHTASPGEAGDQTTNACAYTPYARFAVGRLAGFTIAGNQVTLAAIASFPTRTDAGAAEVATFFGIGTDLAGAGQLLYFGALVGTNLAYECTAIASADTIYAPGTTYSVNDAVVFFTGAESTLPGNITEGMVAYIRTAPGSGTYTLSATLGGGLLDLTSDGAAIVQRLSTITIAQNTTPQLTTGTKVIED